jgi:predicted nucleic acid-binding protein
VTRYVVDASVVMHLLAEGVDPTPERAVLAPTLVRSQVLDSLYRAARSGEISVDEARDRLARFSTMKIRYLGDKVLRRTAWLIATDLDWDSTDDADYLALTRLQADRFVTMDHGLASVASEVVATATPDELLDR